MAVEYKALDSYPPESFVVEVFSELDEATIRERWQAVNVVLRLSMLAGLQMQLDATLNMLCDFAAEITEHDRSLTYFWDENQEQAQLRTVRGLDDIAPETVTRGNLLNFWAAKYSRPLLVTCG